MTAKEFHGLSPAVRAAALELLSISGLPEDTKSKEAVVLAHLMMARAGHILKYPNEVKLSDEHLEFLLGLAEMARHALHDLHVPAEETAALYLAQEKREYGKS
jgi:hypothetical protein